ncbi:MAG: hypothetical protein IKY79_01665 [Bacteroidales bacterium]|nr:hypothetical protein [Bacteroidales bacterium]
MNILDLSWCKFYLHDERYDIGYPLLGASVSTGFFIEIFIVGLIIFPSSIGFYKLPEVSYLPFGIGVGLILAIFIFRNRNKDIRNRRLAEYREYKKKHPRKSTFRFIMFITIPILLVIIDFIIMNTRYNMLHGA